MLRVVGNKIKDGLYDFLPFGCNIVGMVFPVQWQIPNRPAEQPTPELINLLKTAKANHIRIYLNLFLWKNEPGYKEYIDQWVNRLGAAGIYTELCCHTNRDWLGATTKPDSEWINNIVLNRVPAEREECLQWAEQIAARYSTQHMMAGIKILNEPGRWYAGSPDQRPYWRSYVEEAEARIHAINPRYLIYVSGDGGEWGGYLTSFKNNLIDRPNLVYCLHLYPHFLQGELPRTNWVEGYPGHEPNFVNTYCIDGDVAKGLSEMEQVMLYRGFDLTTQVPVMVQETGLTHNFMATCDKSFELHYDFIAKICAKYNVGFMQHCLDPGDAEQGMLNEDWLTYNELGEAWAKIMEEVAPPPKAPIRIVEPLVGAGAGGTIMYLATKKIGYAVVGALTGGVIGNAVTVKLTAEELNDIPLLYPEKS